MDILMKDEGWRGRAAGGLELATKKQALIPKLKSKTTTQNEGMLLQNTQTYAHLINHPL